MMSLLSILLMNAEAPPVPEWNCEEPEVQQEMNWCAHQEYLQTDVTLNEQWALTATFMKVRDETDTSDWDGRPGHFETLLKAQRAWITFRDAHCQTDGYSARGGSIEPLLVSSCMAQLTRIRTKQLEELARTY